MPCILWLDMDSPPQGPEPSPNPKPFFDILNHNSTHNHINSIDFSPHKNLQK